MNVGNAPSFQPFDLQQIFQNGKDRTNGKPSWLDGAPHSLTIEISSLKSDAQLSPAGKDLLCGHFAAKCGKALENDPKTADTVAEAVKDVANTSRLDAPTLEKIANMDIQSLIFFVMAGRANLLDEQVRSMAKEIEERNALMKQTNDMMAMARQTVAKMKDGDTADMPDEMKQFFVDNGIKTAGTSGESSNSGTVITAPPISSTGGAAQSKLEAAQANKSSLETKVSKGEEALKSLNNMGYTDDACIKKDIPNEVRDYCRANGIEVPKGGVSLQKKDVAELKGKLSVHISETRNKLNEQNAAMPALQQQAAAEKAAADQAATAKPESKPEIAISGGSKSTSSITGSQTKEQWQANIENLKGHLEGLNNQSQLDMIKFQSTMSKFTTQIETLSNVMKKLADNTAAIAGNLR